MYRLLGLLIAVLLILAGCSNNPSTGKIQKVGLLVPDTISDQVWGSKGYRGLLKVQSELDVDVYYKEGINTEAEIKAAIDAFQKQGVNLIYGHGSEYAPTFNKIAGSYPNIHFIGFNGDAREDNVTSINFKSHAMGFFGGMVAAEMTTTNKVGIIAAFEWQPEVNGFFEGAYYQNPDVEVKIMFTQSWDDEEKALIYLEDMIVSGTDVVYPAGDAYNVPVINRLKEEGLHAIGFISDQSDLGKGTVLTSTVQNVSEIYKMSAIQHHNGDLKSGNVYYDFQDGAITMGKFSPLVPEDFREEVEAAVDRYRETGKLPNQME